MAASAEELLERITEIGARGAAASEEELDELVSLLGSRAWMDRSADHETGWYDVAPRSPDIVHVADAAQKALAALGGRALVSLAARYDGMPDEARERVRRLVECASLKALAEVGAAERAMLAAGGKNAAKRCEWVDEVLRACAAKDEPRLRDLVVRGVQEDTWIVDRVPEILEHLGDGHSLADALVDAIVRAPADLPRPAFEALANSLRHVAPELDEGFVTKLARVLDGAPSKALASAVVDALAPALAAGKVDAATRQRMLAHCVRLCLEEGNAWQALAWASARLPREEVLALVGPAIGQRLYGDERQIDDALYRIQGIGREVWPWVPLERLEDIATSPTMRDFLRQWANRTLRAITSL